MNPEIENIATHHHAIVLGEAIESTAPYELTVQSGDKVLRTIMTEQEHEVIAAVLSRMK